jgi:hypothetical protein
VEVLYAGGSAGSWACAADVDTNTTYASGSGLTLTGTTFATDNSVVARKDAAAGDQNFAGRIGLGIAVPREKLDVAGAIRIDGMRVFRKYGNNGGASCTDYCLGTQWPGGRGTCLAARIDPTGAYIACSVAAGATPGNTVSCMCAGIDE